MRRLNLNILGLLLLTVLLSNLARADDISRLSDKIDRYFAHTEPSPNDAILLDLANQVIANRQFYSSNTVAKTFSLLSSLASKKGETTKAFQFAKDGLSVAVLEHSVKLALMIQIIAGYYSESRFQEVLLNAQQLLTVADQTTDIKVSLIALSYSAMAHALITNYTQAMHDIQRVQTLMNQHPELSNQIDLIEIFAKANHYLGNYQTALDMYLRLLKLRFDLSKMDNIEQLYFQIATEYRHLGQDDDAFNAYWEARKYAREQSAPIQIAYAELGLAQLLIKQHNYQQAYNSLIKIEKLFQGHNLPQAYLSTLIALATSALHIDKQLFAYQVLTQAEKVAKPLNLTREQLELYRLLAQKYQYQGEYQQALHFLTRYIDNTTHFLAEDRLIAQVKANAKTMSDKSHELAMQLAEQSELKVGYEDRYRHQYYLIQLLLVAIGLLTVAIMISLIKLSRVRANYQSLERERLGNYLSNPEKTRRIYQLEYIKARKYQYPLTIVLLSISNWTDIQAHFRNKVVREVVKTIATLINEHVSEFDCVGRLEDGEYLLLFPHQVASQINGTIVQLAEALNVRFFANLGNFSVIIHHKAANPEAQDIDPFVFLSTLAE